MTLLETRLRVLDAECVESFRNLTNLNRVPRLTYAFSHRAFGNMAFPYGEESDVILNRRKFLTAADIDSNNTVFMSPVHQSRIEIVGRKDRGKGMLDFASSIQATDALITCEDQVALGLNVADCAPIIITNAMLEFVALVHAGRDGTNLQICRLVIQRLKGLGFSDPSQFLVGIGPTIGCYEQDYIRTQNPDSWLGFVGVSKDSDAEIIPSEPSELDLLQPPTYEIRSTNGAKLYVNLVDHNIVQLIQAGVTPENIRASYICTACNSEEYRLFSHVVTTKYSGTEKASSYPEGRFMAVTQLAF